MSVIVALPASLRHECNGRRELTVRVGTVRSILDLLESDHPSLYRCVCDDAGCVRPHINLFLNNNLLDKIRGLDQSLQAGDTLSIMPAVSGG